MRYSVFKKVLADLHVGRTAAGTAPFEAKLKDFRKRGVPPVAPGKGTLANLALEDLAETHFALRLNYSAIPPAMIVQIVEEIRREGLWRKVKRHKGDDIWLGLTITVSPPELWYFSALPLQRLFDELRKDERDRAPSYAQVVLNLSQLLREVSTLSDAISGAGDGWVDL